MLPVDLGEENTDTAVMLPRNRQLLAYSKRFHVPYDGLGTRSKWRHALRELERHDVINIAWRGSFALITPILTKQEQEARFSE